MLARRAGLVLTYNGTDITADLSKCLLNWTYTDNMSGESDDLQINLEDRRQLWINDWFPDVGASLNATITRKNWSRDGQEDRLNVGLFEIDEIEINHPPSTVTIKALSIPESTGSIRLQKKNKAWEATTLSGVGGSVAGAAGVGFFFDSPHDPSYDRVEQTEQTDLEFLQKLCNDAGLSLKVAEGMIIIFDDAKYEQQSPIATIERGKLEISSYSARTSLDQVYSACTVEYTDASQKETFKYTFAPPTAPSTGKVLQVNQRVTSLAEAISLAKRKLRQENTKETEVNITIPGDTKFVAAVTVQLKGFGIFDGIYIITQAVHSQEDRYETKLQLRKCLEW